MYITIENTFVYELDNSQIFKAHFTTNPYYNTFKQSSLKPTALKQYFKRFEDSPRFHK